ncbi:type I-U CRISPR-associated helicase/endonuclease Cas3 [Coraliomargarita sp. SDUM461004]|uniref:Type I-U CRISPR-associated helicase/endonuclease Cas3 n=1 Tax=Thalassobacterium sedimentorum TaxID=3041258 RepID=A0ABU1ALX7_9BACT|nr:type I-U CRISPR-associated helicase/endonuclease Cas3 [Coraliomargarita sp. SDUM461004]MDQ8195796.1 type I-U CRISPR-associated helicase/endonuclease Cas3 [Coraliomargarita sp. SDUM461004]
MTFPTFPEFFRALYGFDPFPWQIDLAKKAVIGQWPDYLAVPTGSGKTACIDIAIYALAAQATLSPTERTVGRRIFFIVNRRVIVDEAYDRSLKIAKRLLSPENEPPAIKAVAERLKSLSPTTAKAAPPLDCVQLRGAIYRDDRWARSLTQPTVIASTVDQVGSRMLFRGYGLSNGACPIHAALVAHDSLLLLDEAHISRPFAETIESIKKYRASTRRQTTVSEAVNTPFHFLQMTATPPKFSGKEAPVVLHLTENDTENATLARRLNTQKLARLEIAENIKGKKACLKIAADLAKRAQTLFAESKPDSLAILVNRVATAREVEKLLKKQFNKSHSEVNISLLIGRMRPIDRDKHTKQITEELKTSYTEPGSSNPLKNSPRIVIATQCLEVGADYDFHAMITECASLDALRQRFGRLNRSGLKQNTAPTIIVMRSDLIETSAKKLDATDAAGKPLDPVYGNAASHTWNWLNQIAGEQQTVDFGILSMDETLRLNAPADLSKLLAPSPHAPALFPAYLDAWAQTNPRPSPDPDPALFLHGPKAGQAEIQICWRRDLPESLDAGDALVQTVSLCPPSSPEMLSVPLWLFRQWFFLTELSTDLLSDLLLQAPPNEDEKGKSKRIEKRSIALIWKGLSESTLLERPDQIRPGDTIILPTNTGGWDTFGHIPEAPLDPVLSPSSEDVSQNKYPEIDIAEDAFRQSKNQEIVRFDRTRIEQLKHTTQTSDFVNWLEDADSSLTKSQINSRLKEIAGQLEEASDLRHSIENLCRLGFNYTRYPNDKGAVFISKAQISNRPLQLTALGDEDDALSKTEAIAAVTLPDHTEHVLQHLSQTLRFLPLNDFSDSLKMAALWHDSGKLDERFQALLCRGNLNAAMALNEPLAKSKNLSLTVKERQQARDRSKIPKGFRHEMLSLGLAKKGLEESENENCSYRKDLILHLIAAHHGHARPFAPVVQDDSPPQIESTKIKSIQVPDLNCDERLKMPAHRVDSGVAERFWEMTKELGPWDLAYLETALRLADQQTSEAESEGLI